MTRRDNTITLVLAAFIALGAAVATWRILANGASVPDLHPFWWGVIVGLAVGLRAKGRLGEYRQAARHTFLGVGRGHLQLIRGARR